VVRRTQRLERGSSGGVLGAGRVDNQRLGPRRRSSGCGPRAKEEEGREKEKKEGQYPDGSWASSVSSDVPSLGTCRERKQENEWERKMKKNQCRAGSWTSRCRDVWHSSHKLVQPM